MTRRAIGAAAAIVVAAMAWGVSASAQTTGSLVLDSPPGDWVGGGQFWQYDSASAAFSTQSDGSMITINVFGNSGDWWTVQLAAPPGQTMAVGSYENAVRASFRPPGVPGIDVFGMGRGCNQQAGRFDVTQVTFGPNGYVESFSALFEQSCEGFMPALRGEVHAQNPPPPPALSIALTVSEALLSKVSGAATVRGTLTCNRAADVSVGITLTQRVSRTEVMQGFSGQFLHCEAPGMPVQVVVTESSGRSFVKGRPLELVATLSAFDPAYGNSVNVTSTNVVKLK